MKNLDRVVLSRPIIGFIPSELCNPEKVPDFTSEAIGLEIPCLRTKTDTGLYLLGEWALHLAKQTETLLSPDLQTKDPSIAIALLLNDIIVRTTTPPKIERGIRVSNDLECTDGIVKIKVTKPKKTTDEAFHPFDFSKFKPKEAGILVPNCTEALWNFIAYPSTESDLSKAYTHARFAILGPLRAHAVDYTFGSSHHLQRKNK